MFRHQLVVVKGARTSALSVPTPLSVPIRLYHIGNAATGNGYSGRDGNESSNQEDISNRGGSQWPELRRTSTPWQPMACTTRRPLASIRRGTVTTTETRTRPMSTVQEWSAQSSGRRARLDREGMPHKSKHLESTRGTGNRDSYSRDPPRERREAPQKYPSLGPRQTERTERDTNSRPSSHERREAPHRYSSLDQRSTSSKNENTSLTSSFSQGRAQYSKLVRKSTPAPELYTNTSSRPRGGGTRFDERMSRHLEPGRNPKIPENKSPQRYTFSSAKPINEGFQEPNAPGRRSPITPGSRTRNRKEADIARMLGIPAELQKDEPRSNQLTIRKFDSGVPLSIPYTTPASEFLYGTSVVEAALRSTKSPRRKLYKLYIYNGENRGSSERDSIIANLARLNGVEVVYAGNSWTRLLDKMSGGRPHNGYVLEASPLPKLPVVALGDLTTKNGQDGYEVELGQQSREEALINGIDNFIPLPKKDGRNPFVLYLDSILDPGNLGGIIRTAHFLGASAVAVSVHNVAPFSPVTLKASAGASENVNFFIVKKPAHFIYKSKQAGWKVYAAVSPSHTTDAKGNSRLSISTTEIGDPLSEAPCILMLGSEGEGLRENLREKADVDLFIGGSGESQTIDSLNVSVAAGVLCNAFLTKNKVVPKVERKGDLF